jgi:hypothetical protein
MWAAVVVCRRVAEEDLDLGALTRVQGARRGGVVPVARATPVDPVVPVVPATSVDRVVRETSAVPVAPATSDRGLPTPSAASVVPRGVMEQRRGAGEHRRGPGGAGPSRRRVECGTQGRSTTGATTSNRYGIRAKTGGASISSESGSRCNEPAATAPQRRSGRWTLSLKTLWSAQHRTLIRLAARASRCTPLGNFRFRGVETE